MSKDFKFSLKNKNNQILVQEIVSFGSEKNPFPDNWRDNPLAVKALHDYKEEFLYNHLDVTFEEGSELDI